MTSKAAKLNICKFFTLWLLFGLIFSACSEIAPSNQLLIWSLPEARPALESQLAAFRQEYPNFEVKIQPMERETLYEKLLAGYQAGGVNLPDIATLEDDRLDFFNEKFPNAFSNLNDYFSELRSDFLASKWAQTEYKNKIRALPWEAAPVALYYRADLLPNLAKYETWEAILTRKTQNELSEFHLGLDISREDFSRTLINQQKSAWFSSDKRINLLSSESNNVFSTLEKLSRAGIIETFSGAIELKEALAKQRITAYLATPSFAHFLQKEIPAQSGLWRVMLLPVLAKGDAQAAQLGGLSLVISSKSANQVAARRFLQISLATTEGQKHAWVAAGILPAFLPTLQQDLFSDKQSYFGGQAVGQIFTQQLSQLAPLRFTEYQPTTESVIKETQQTILQGGSADEALKKAATKLKQLTGKEFYRPD